jgi:hypothetical protein
MNYLEDNWGDPVSESWHDMAGYVARTGEKRNAYRILVGMPEGKRPLGRPKRRRVDNIKMDLKRDRMSLYRLD